MGHAEYEAPTRFSDIQTTNRRWDMKVMRYRAATMRDATEKVKREPGEEALVLGSRSVRRRGMFGFGANAEIDRLRPEVCEVKFTLTRPIQNLATGSNFSYNVNGCDSVVYDSPCYETYLYLAGLGLNPYIARAAVHGATGTQAQNERELAEIGLINGLPSIIEFGSDPQGGPAAAIPAAAAARLPLAHLCTGQRVPEYTERANPRSLAANALQTIATAIAAYALT